MTTPNLPGEKRDALIAIAAEHPISRWSDNTYGCRACADRYERESTRETFDMATYVSLSKPDWTYVEACAHVTEHQAPLIAGWLAEAKGEAWDEGYDEGMDDHLVSNPYRAEASDQ